MPILDRLRLGRPDAAADRGPARADPQPGALRFINVTKSFATVGDGRKYVIRDASFDIPAGRKIALLGRNGAGKSTLLSVISGAQDVDCGRIERHGTVSYPIGYGGSFHGDLTGAQNARFVARVHGVDTEALLAYVHEFTELGDFFFMPLRTYSSGMRARLTFAVSMCLPFDCYLVDEITAVGDQAFRDRAVEAFRTRLQRATAIFATHNLSQAAAICDMGAVLNDGEMQLFASVDDAIEVHRANLQTADP